MKIRNLHVIIMLIAGIIVAIFSLINNYDMMTLILTMLIVLIIFFVLGQIIQSYINKIYKKMDHLEKAKQLRDMEDEYSRMQELNEKDQ